MTIGTSVCATSRSILTNSAAQIILFQFGTLVLNILKTAVIGFEFEFKSSTASMSTPSVVIFLLAESWIHSTFVHIMTSSSQQMNDKCLDCVATAQSTQRTLVYVHALVTAAHFVT